MNDSIVIPVLTWTGMACWGVCFWWMHRISKRQDSMLRELQEMTGRIEKFAKAEHDVIQEVHPAVADIKETVKDIEETMPGAKSQTPPRAP